MARSLRYFVPMLGLLAVYFLLSGTPASAQAAPAPDSNVAAAFPREGVAGIQKRPPGFQGEAI